MSSVLWVLAEIVYKLVSFLFAYVLVSFLVSSQEDLNPKHKVVRCFVLAMVTYYTIKCVKSL